MRILALLPGLLALGACFPPTHSRDFDVPYARSYWYWSQTDPSRAPALSRMTIEQLWSVHQYGRRAFHPWRGVAGPIACRGAAAVPFLKTRINPHNVGVLLELFIWMRWLETYEPSSDADLMARLQSAFAAMPKDLRKTYADQFTQVQGGPDNGPRGMVKYDSTANLRARACRGLDSASPTG